MWVVGCKVNCLLVLGLGWWRLLLILVEFTFTLNVRMFFVTLKGKEKHFCKDWADFYKRVKYPNIRWSLLLPKPFLLLNCLAYNCKNIENISFRLINGKYIFSPGCFPMSSQSRCTNVLLITALANVRPIICVQSLVQFQMNKLSELLRTQITLVWFLSTM